MNQQTSTPLKKSSLKSLFDETRHRLVDTGTSNKLVHVNRSNTRGNVINITSQNSNHVFKALSNGESMRFRALGSDNKQADDIILDENEPDADQDDIGDAQLPTKLGPDALLKKLLKIAREAQTAEEEQGVSILYLALGFLTWFEDPNSDKQREAPLVLLPVELERDKRSSNFNVRLREDELITNLPLQRRLNEDFGLKLPEVEPDDDWQPSTYFDQVEEMIEDQPRWKIDRDGIQLGFFSFLKLLMFLDLDPEKWPNGSLEKHELTRKLLFEGFEPENPSLSPTDALDEALPPDKLCHVVDADASQARVIEEVLVGRNLVVQGPPGTGKSQTITNIIAGAVSQGKSVLFVAEKMAALSVVHNRLVKCGLADTCLELHSKSANKRAVLGELARTLNSQDAVPEMPNPPELLKARRDELNTIDEALHSPIGSTGETPFSVLARQVRFIGMEAPMPTLDGDFLSTMTRQEEEKMCTQLATFGEVVEKAGPEDQHPFAGVSAIDLQPVELNRLVKELDKSSQSFIDARKAIDASMSALTLDRARSLAIVPSLDDTLSRLKGLPALHGELARQLYGIADLDRLCDALEVAANWQQERKSASESFIDQAFEEPVVELRKALKGGTSSLITRWGKAYRKASRELTDLLKVDKPKSAEERLKLADQLLNIQSLRKQWANDEEFMASMLGSAWRGEQTDFSTASVVANWCRDVRNGPLTLQADTAISIAVDADQLAALTSNLAATAPAAEDAAGFVIQKLGMKREELLGANDELDLEHAASRLQKIVASEERYSEWTHLCRLRQELAEANLGDLAARIASGEITAKAAQIELRFARAERLWRDTIEASPELKEIGIRDRNALVSEFKELEHQHFDDNIKTILANHLSQLPRGAQGEMGVIRSEIGKKQRHLPLRQLFLKAPTAIQRIKPVLLMSPISVAQFLPPGQINFDLLVFDEASQVRPEDALGAIARSNQIVVVGDQKQLPPTSFFTRLVEGEEDADQLDEEASELLGGAATVGELESILSLCEARGLSSEMLKWHYRSRDPSLIKVSNKEFYHNKLILPPSPLQKDPSYGLTLTRVDGAYDKSGRRDNRIEGESVVKRVAEHAHQTPDLSLGIVTFSAAQRNTLTELLEAARRNDNTLDAFLREGKRENLFVKNIENVQGDERDVILISVGYGPTTPGERLATMHFGPVNSSGGERRLNVLFTRARIRCEVFVSFDPGDIDINRTNNVGMKTLKGYLDFAQTGKINDTTITGNEADSDFEVDVADVIRHLGFLADPQVGSAGFYIDIGVRHPDRPGTYLLAVECDGATYHSALWARERDRLRQEVLEHLGWRFHRIWSTDWFYHRSNQIERLRQALIKAHEDADNGPQVDGANSRSLDKEPATETPSLQEPAAVPEIVDRKIPKYDRAHFPVNTKNDPHQAQQQTLSTLVQKIVAFEGPICVKEVSRRVATCFGQKKAGKRTDEITLRTLEDLRQSNTKLRSDENNEFWFTAEQETTPPVRDRSEESGPTRKADAISLLEIRSAIALARADNAGGTDEELILAAARMLGFQRVGTELKDRIAKGL